MRHLLIIQPNESDAVPAESINAWLKKTAFAYTDVYVKVISFSLTLEQTTVHPAEKHWFTVEEAVAHLSSCMSQEAREEWHNSLMAESKNVATLVHEVADSLPYLGFSLDVILFMSSAVSLNFDSCLSMAGALCRLRSWHNARNVIVKMEQELSSLVWQLAEFGHCLIIKSIEDLVADMGHWTGKVAVRDHIENKGQIFSGFTLHCEEWDTFLQKKHPCHQQNVKRKVPAAVSKRQKVNDAPQSCMQQQRLVCGRTIEVLQEVDLRTFPLYLLDSWTLKLCVEDGHSKTLINYIQDLQQVGILARLRLYPDSKKIPVCGDVTNMTTMAWKERIMSHYQNTQEPDEEEVASGMEFLYFLLLPNISVSPKTQETFVVAQAVLSPYEINRDLFCVFESHILPANSQSRTKSCKRDSHGENVCSERLLAQRDKFALMLELLEKYTMKAFTDFHAETSSDASKTTLDKLAETISDVQIKIVEAAFTGCVSLNEDMENASRKGIRQNIKWFPEASLDPSKFPERLALQGKDSTRRALQTFASVDSFSASSPLSLADLEKKKNSTDFHINDVLQFFKLDGSHLTLPVSPVKLKGHSLCRVESQPDLGAAWPDSQLLKYHDVYYYLDDFDRRLERKYAKVRDKGTFDETRSSFLSPQKKKSLPVKPAVSLSPVRRSPRKSASSHQHLMTRCKSDVSQSSSEKPKAASLFKQPAARSQSPKRRQSLNSSTLSSTPQLYQSFGSSSDSSGSYTPQLVSSNSRDKSLHQTLSQSQETPTSVRNYRRSPRKRVPLLTPHSHQSSSFEIKHPRFTSVLTQDPPVRRSPRKSTGALFSTPGSSGMSSQKLRGRPSHDSSDASDTPGSISQRRKSSPSSQTGSDGKQLTKMKRSDRHKMKLQRIIDHVLEEKGVKPGDQIHAACSRNLFNVSMVLLKTLTTSENLTEEMKTVVYAQVTQIINLEKRRCGLKV